jgi:hypothetical protein
LSVSAVMNAAVAARKSSPTMAAVGLVDAVVGRSPGGSAARGEAGSTKVGGGTISGVLIMGDPSSV